MNITLFYFLFNLSSTPPGAAVAYFLAVIFPYLILLLTAVFFIIRFRHVFSSTRPLNDAADIVREACFVALTATGSWFLATLLKYLFHTDRPFIALTNITALFNAANYSFPSGHATTFAALACAIFILDRKWGIFFIFSALLIGVARVAVGVHYPRDVIVGFAIGALVTFVIRYIVFKKIAQSR